MKLFTCFALFAAAAAADPDGDFYGSRSHPTDRDNYRREIMHRPITYRKHHWRPLKHRAAVKNNQTGEFECVDSTLSGKAVPGHTHVHVYDEGDEYVGKFKVANNDFQIYKPIK